MILRQESRPPDHPQHAGDHVLEFEDLWSEHRQLRGWLESATMGLVAPAKQRIRTEIEAHYREAVAAHVAEGLSEPHAKIAAVAELGDAVAAWKRFRKSHLTAEDAKQAARYLKVARSVWWLLCMYLLFCFVRFLERDPMHERPDLAPSVFFAIEFLSLVVVPTACYFRRQAQELKPEHVFDCLYAEQCLLRVLAL